MENAVRPDYEGACLSNVVSALLGSRVDEWLPEPVRGARAVVLLVMDGLGWDVLDERAPTMRAMQGGPITTVVPSSTTAALTSLTTGRAPTEHGITGIVVRTEGVSLHTLRWRAGPQQPVPDPARVQTVAPFGGRAIPVVTRAEFDGSGFTEAHLRGARFVPWYTVSSLAINVLSLIRGGEPFVYAYYEGVDSVSHLYGTNSPFTDAEIGFSDGIVAWLLDRLPSDVALVVTADHGQVPLDAGSWIDLSPLSTYASAFSGDGRCRYAYAIPGRAADLARAARDLAGERGWVLERERFLDEGWAGPATALAMERVGDVVLLGRDAAFLDPAHAGEKAMRSGHGSVTRGEMLVPLIAARGRA